MEDTILSSQRFNYWLRRFLTMVLPRERSYFERSSTELPALTDREGLEPSASRTEQFQIYRHIFTRLFYFIAKNR